MTLGRVATETAKLNSRTFLSHFPKLLRCIFTGLEILFSQLFYYVPTFFYWYSLLKKKFDVKHLDYQLLIASTIPVVKEHRIAIN